MNASPDDAAASPKLRRPSVLILDDDPTSLRVAYFSLRNHYEVFACETLQQAVALVREEVIDYLISDFYLGYGQTGAEALKRLRSEPTFDPVACFLLTSNPEPAVRDIALAAGFRKVFHKPITREFRAFFTNQFDSADTHSNF
ncbi:MAG: response regulator [Opitutales bacterium]|nr:response regulator [Opitutales bacterium]